MAFSLLATPSTIVPGVEVLVPHSHDGNETLGSKALSSF